MAKRILPINYLKFPAGILIDRKRCAGGLSNGSFVDAKNWNHMADVSYRKELADITDILLQQETNFLALKTALERYKNLLIQVSGIEMDNEQYRRDLQLEDGKALGTAWAVTCIDDLLRTKRFVKGIFHAVESIKKTVSRPVQILYAGSGPFAALVLPLTTRFTSEEVEFSLLEVNEHSHHFVTKVVADLGLGHYCKLIDHADAATYKLRANHEVDILLTETMRSGLTEEMQVPIVLNLVSQIQGEFQLIPEKVTVDLGLTSAISSESGIEGQGYMKLGPILELSQQSLVNLQSRLPSQTTKLNPLITKGYSNLVILTEITVFGDQVIGFNDSGLTIPLILDDLDNLKDQPYNISTSFKLQPFPKIDYQLTPLTDPPFEQP